MIRTGLFRLVRHHDVQRFHLMGWMITDTLDGTPHGAWSVLMWRCDCWGRG